MYTYLKCIHPNSVCDSDKIPTILIENMAAMLAAPSARTF